MPTATRKKHYGETTLVKIDKVKWRVFMGVCQLLGHEPHYKLYDLMQEFIRENSAEIKKMMGEL